MHKNELRLWDLTEHEYEGLRKEAEQLGPKHLEALQDQLLRQKKFNNEEV